MRAPLARVVVVDNTPTRIGPSAAAAARERARQRNPSWSVLLSTYPLHQISEMDCGKALAIEQLEGFIAQAQLSLANLREGRPTP